MTDEKQLELLFKIRSEMLSLLKKRLLPHTNELSMPDVSRLITILLSSTIAELVCKLLSSEGADDQDDRYIDMIASKAKEMLFQARNEGEKANQCN